MRLSVNFLNNNKPTVYNHSRQKYQKIFWAKKLSEIFDCGRSIAEFLINNHFLLLNESSVSQRQDGILAIWRKHMPTLWKRDKFFWLRWKQLSIATKECVLLSFVSSCKFFSQRYNLNRLKFLEDCLRMLRSNNIRKNFMIACYFLNLCDNFPVCRAK